MADVNSSNKTIAKNTAFLYIRMLFVMAVSIYSSRIVLNALGVEDYGLYNVVGGFVSMLSFLNGAAAGATSRFLTINLGKNDLINYQRTFSVAFFIHLAIAFVIVILGETVGLWFVMNKMTIDSARMDAALWVYQLSLLSVFISFTQVPYNASVISHEHMSIYAYVSIFEALAKLGILYILLASPYDKLKTYALLILIVTVSVAVFYRVYCTRKYKECKLSWIRDKLMYRQLLSYAGWDTLGALTGVAMTQGINVVLNLFFGPAINAARGIAYQVDAAVTSFITNFLTAVKPQVTKAFAGDNIERMVILTVFSAKYTVLMFTVFAIPLIFEAPYVLKLWLGNPPEYAACFLQLVLIDKYTCVLCDQINVAIHATGDVKRLNLYAGILCILKLPIAYLMFLFGMSVISVFWMLIIGSILCLIVDLYVLTLNIRFPVRKFLIETVVKNVFLMAIPITICFCLYFYMNDSFLRLVLITVVYFILLMIMIYTLGISKKDRNKVNQFILSKFNVNN